jgi:hypothetical protein
MNLIPDPVSLISELSEEFGKGKIFEARLNSLRKREHLYGILDPDRQEIVIDPRRAIVETLIHELLHRRFPKWSERRVRQAEKSIMADMALEDVWMWYRRYKRSAKKFGRVDVVD